MQQDNSEQVILDPKLIARDYIRNMISNFPGVFLFFCIKAPLYMCSSTGLGNKQCILKLSNETTCIASPIVKKMILKQAKYKEKT